MFNIHIVVTILAVYDETPCKRKMFHSETQPWQKRREVCPAGVNVCGIQWNDVYSETTPMARRAGCLRIKATMRDTLCNCDVGPS